MLTRPAPRACSLTARVETRSSRRRFAATRTRFAARDGLLSIANVSSSLGRSVAIEDVRVVERRGTRSARDARARAVPVAEIGELESGIQGLYLGSLLSILGGAAYIVVRQVLIRRELDDQAKKMGERIRAGNASAEDYFEMGSILLRKKVFTQAVRNLQAAAANWDGDEQDLALVHNALGFGYSNTDKIDDAIAEFKKSVALQPGYVTAWNNLGEAYEKKKELKEAIKCYEESLVLSPKNPTATERLEEIQTRLRRRLEL